MIGNDNIPAPGSAILKAILAGQHAAEAACALERNRVIEAGPPAGSPVTREAWRDWHRYGFVVCPRRKTTCSELEAM